MPYISGVNEDAIINKLISRGVITRSEYIRGRYTIIDGGQTTYRRPAIMARFAVRVSEGRFRLNIEEVNRALQAGRPIPQPEPERPVLRRINRQGYHSGSRNIESALARIQPDADGVVRSFGIEYEVYALTAEQEDKLANLLDTLPAHVTERDGSLDSTGVEIVFDPVGADDYIRIVRTLGNFVRENNVQMNAPFNPDRMAGMHTTYGVSNYEASKEDLQIRLNRFALSVKAVGTQQQIKQMFGRDFGHYRELPGQNDTHNALLYNTHGNAFSCNGRPRSCWECRLLAWNCDPARMVEFFRATESAFHRPVNAADFNKVFELLGSDTAGC